MRFPESSFRQQPLPFMVGAMLQLATAQSSKADSAVFRSRGFGSAHHFRTTQPVIFRSAGFVFDEPQQLEVKEMVDLLFTRAVSLLEIAFAVCVCAASASSYWVASSRLHITETFAVFATPMSLARVA